MKQEIVAVTHSLVRTILKPIIFMICLMGMSAQAATQDSKYPQAFHDCQGCPEMVVIPAGSFRMGVKNSSYSPTGSALATIGSERNLHQVSVSKFAIGKTEVTQGQWRAVMGNNPSHFNKCGDSCPVEQVNWDDAKLFIQKLNEITGKQYRLPSEAEWEYACRAGQEEDFCGSEVAGDVAWYSHNSSGITQPSSVLHANAWGLYDMSGNVMEWVEDSWHKSFGGAPADGSAWQGDGAYHVVRGGASNDSAKNIKSYSRNYYGVGSRYSSIGFRLATSVVSSVSNEKPMPLVFIPKEIQKTGEKYTAIDRLKELESMRTQGLITDNEYQQKRKQILEKF
jgi:formylglycine-generating enzyme required for sulfatase activity